MTRKDFLIIARIIRAIAHGPTRNEVIRVAREELRADNPRFDEGRFEVACWAKDPNREWV